MSKGTHFIGQPLFGQLISLLDKSKILKFSREIDGERYVKHFNAWQHMVIMLYAVIKRFDSLREITDSMFPEARKLSHLGINMMPRRSTLSDANARRIDTVKAEIENETKYWNEKEFNHMFMKSIEEWKSDLYQKMENRETFMKQVQLNMDDKKISRLKRIHIIFD